MKAIVVSVNGSVRRANSGPSPSPMLTGSLGSDPPLSWFPLSLFVGAMVVVSLRKQPNGLGWREDAARARRPSLPVIPQNSPLAMSSVGHQRTRRPSLYEWHAYEQNNRYHPDIEGQVNYCIASFPDGNEVSLVIDPSMRLYELFEEPLRTRGMSVNDVAFYLEGSHTPVPENSESRFFVGQRILIRGRGAMRVGRHSRATASMDESPGDRPTRKMSAEAVSRKSSFANSRMMAKTSRQHSENKLFNGSDETEGRSNDSSLRDISILDDASTSAEPYDDGGTRRARSVASSRISLFSFGKDKNEVVARLEEMKANSPSSDTFRDLEIEAHWKEIVKQDLPSRLAKQQEALWELVTTEKSYIDVLRNMADLKFYLHELKRDGYLKDIEVDRVFRNYDELFNKHYHCFWQKYIMKMLGLSRSTGAPLEASLLEEWFTNIMDWSRNYTDFTDKHHDSLTYLQKKRKDNHIFAEFVMWAESQQGMRRQKLSDTLAVPMQRITRYGLLLNAVVREAPDQEERSRIQYMIDCVNRATHQLNFEMNNNDLQRQLLDIQAQIDGYDCIDQEEYEKLFGHRCMLNLVQPMRFPPPLDGPPHIHRRLFFRGDLKMRESKQGQKMDVYCYVFTDMFLICRKKADRLRILRPPIHMSQCAYHQATETTFYILHMNPFGTCSQLYIMQTGNAEDTNKWMDQLKMAFDEFGKVNFQRVEMSRAYDSPMEELAAPGWPNGRFRSYIPVGPVGSVHRKSSSMDSQCMAAHAHMNHMHRVHAISSTEQLDRVTDRLDSPSRLIPRHKLSVASCSAAALSSSKSSVDLHLSESHAGIQRTRSRSNSSGPEIDGKRLSRSPSPRGANDENPPVNGVEANGNEEEPIPSHGRRFEKRYHTADGFELKPRGTQSILKRFSLNVNGGGGSSRKISARLGEHSRRHSQASTAASSDSFGSSTSGISSASDGIETTTKCHISQHVTSVAVNESPSESTLNISLDELSLDATPEKEEKASPPAPPLPEIPPPTEPEIPKEENKREELLKFILDSKLETSDV